MTNFLVMGLLAFTVAVMVLFAMGNTKGKGKYISGLAATGFVMVGVAYFEKDRVAASLLELSVLLASIFLGVLVSKNVLDKSSYYVDELFKDEDKGKPEPEAQAAEEQPQPKSSSESSNEKYVDLLKKAAKLSIFAVPFLLIVNISMQLILPVVKADDNSVIEHLGTFGDFFGGTLNPVLTFATFIALIATILIQLKELRLTREELKNSNEQLKMSRKEQEKTAKALQEQERTQRIKQFEGTFFSLFDRIVLDQNRMEGLFKETIKYGLNKADGEIDASDFCKIIIRSNRSVIIFMILIYQLMKLVDGFNIDKRPISEQVKDPDLIFKLPKDNFEQTVIRKRFINILRASLSHDVVFILFVNCSSLNKSFGSDFDKYRDYVEKYSFFEHLDLSEFLLTGDPYGMDDEEFDSAIKISPINNQKHIENIFRELFSSYRVNAFGKSVYIDQFK